MSASTKPRANGDPVKNFVSQLAGSDEHNYYRFKPDAKQFVPDTSESRTPLDDAELTEHGWSLISVTPDRDGVSTCSLRREDAEAPYQPREVAIAGLEDGKILWLHRGRLWCSVTRTTVVESREDQKTACRFTGGQVGHPYGADDTTTDARFQLESIDTPSGEVQWHQKAGRTRTSDITLPADSEGRAFLSPKSGDVLVDLTTGETEPADGALVWRPSNESFSIDDQTVNVSSWAVLRPTVDGDIAEELRWPLPDDVGLQAGDLRVLPRPVGIVAYRQAA